MLPPIEFTLGERVKLNATGVEFTPMVNATLFIRGGIYFEISGIHDFYKKSILVLAIPLKIVYNVKRTEEIETMSP